MASKKTEELPANRDRILKGAAALYAKRGFHAVGMNELCAALDLSRGAFYHYFPSKDDLLEEICRQYMTKLLHLAKVSKAEESDPTMRLRRLGSELISVIGAHRDELAVCFRETISLADDRRQGVLALHAAYERIWKETLIEGEKTGVFVPYSRFRLKALLGMYYYSYLWIDPTSTSSIRQTNETFESILAAVSSRSQP
ncbi:TetR family transcriptional regulator [Achromobacter sp. MYb9]|uniref:TetR/AcrR family transcriptional regulator n=1 Tax=Achromobacter sp. MYb9 TaxID=1827284 RepID=UPI000CFAADF6|nr:TetR/AcrR family transcriptional regulator [Achromobacter sp. MYb9]PQZ67676.1 TetR family transcriptional regulator [Achromobacter sp. MYb9]